MTMSTQNPGEPVKRKRGRPPKHAKPASFPTMTLQFDTSPHASPPELNSNRMVQIGEPDAFTPLMKVSPMRRKRRASDLPRVMLTPKSVHTPGRLSSAIDTMSELTQLAVYNTPPESLARDKRGSLGETRGMEGFSGSIGNSMGNSIGNMGNSIRNMGNSIATIGNSMGSNMGNSVSSIGSIDSIGGPIDSLLDAPARGRGYDLPRIVSQPTTNTAAQQHKISAPDKGRVAASSSANRIGLDGTLSLSTVGILSGNGLGKARGPDLSSSASVAPKMRGNPSSEGSAASTHPSSPIRRVNYIDDGAFSFQLVVDDLGRAKLSRRGSTAQEHKTEQKQEQKLQEQKSQPKAPEPESPKQELEAFLPRLQHANTAIGIETLRDDDIVPQTPKTLDDIDGCDALAYNLTPQFNSMMYQMMNINSPQQRRNPVQPFISVHDPLRGSIETELLARADRMDRPESMDARRLERIQPLTQALSVATLSHSQSLEDASMSSPDEEDARVALKRVVRKREMGEQVQA